jgi:DNA-directed RNA polymerase subunit M/transcription elongation factor TFIIS
MRLFQISSHTQNRWKNVLNYCPMCNNLLIPRGEKLVCRICNAEYQLVDNEEKAHKNLVPLNKS